MTLKALFYAYLLGGITFIPLLVAAVIFFTIYTSVPIGDPDLTKNAKARLERDGRTEEEHSSPEFDDTVTTAADVNDIPKNRKGWLTMRRTFEESTTDGSYVALVRTFLDARSKDPKKSRPKDMWYVVLKGKVLYLYEDEGMTECEAVIELGGHDVIIYPEGLLDGELYAKRNSICLRPKLPPVNGVPSLTKEMKFGDEDVERKVEEMGGSTRKKEKEREKLTEAENIKEAARAEALSTSTPWFIFVRSNVEMEDWYFALLHASDHPAQTPTLAPLHPIFQPSDMNHLVATLDEQPDVIPMRWLNALLGRIFFSYYRTQTLEKYIIGRLMKKLSKIKRPTLLSDIVVTEVSVGNKAPTLSKPMLKELTKEGDASLEVHLHYKGEVRITIEATATINLGARFKSYTVKLVLAAVLKELEGNLLIKVKRPPSNRIWYAFTQTPRMVLEVEPIVSDRQITWGMILSTIESRLKEVIQESIVLPNMDDIAFFESSKYQHRGGIWADAARNEKPVSSVPDPTPSTNENQSTMSVPIPEDSATPLVQVEQPSPLRQSHSTENLSGTAGLSTYSDAQPFPSASGSTVDDPSGYSRNNKRRSWFSTTSVASAMEQSTSLDGVINERGRTSDVEERQSSGIRSQSTPGRPESIPDVEDSEHSSDDPSHLTPHSTSSRRSSSHNSPIREHAKKDSFHEDDDDFPLTSTRSYSSPTTPTPPNNRSSSSHQDSHAHTSPTSPGGSSFLSTLKSRAGDKQALSNSAREAMRKWGVNWGGLKKDSSSGGSSANEDMPDHGSVGSGSRSRVDAATQKARASYAEVRAAVAERKNKERNAHGEDGAGTGTGTAPASLPIPIPEGTRNKARAASYSSAMSSTSFPGGVSTSTSSSSTSSSGKDQPQERRRTSSTMSRAASSTDAPPSSQEGHAQKISLPEDSPPTPPSPIHVQPQAKMMTIPGIHASHRGEVMSMGHVAARPQTPPPLESKLKNINPGIQSVYRLWKSPTSASSSQEGTTSSIIQNDSTTTEPAESSAAVVDRVPSISSSPPSRPVPPPLPPRSTVSRPPVASFTSQAASASDALKSIATRDDSTRASLDRSPQGSPPSANGIINRRISINNNSISNVDADIDGEINIPTITPRPNNPGPPLPPRRTASTSA